MPLKNAAKPKPYVRWDKVPVFITLAELATLFDGDQETLRKLVKSGEIPGAKKIGARWIVDRDTLRRYFEGDYSPPRISAADADAIAALVVEKILRTRGGLA